MDKTMRVADAHAAEADPLSKLSPDAARIARERPLLHPDTPGGADDLGRAAEAAFLAEVLLHRRVETPFCLGLFGAAGSGKTSFLDQLAGAVDRLGQAAGGEGPFVKDTVVVRVDAGAAGEPGTLLAEAVAERLGETHPALAAELAHAGADPVEAARQAAEALNDARRRHEGERQTLDDLGRRDARLVEAVMETPGSSIDAYAHGHRSAIERALRQFGFDTGDAVTTFKQLSREAAESPGAPSRIALGMRALWTYRGQMRLVVLALVFALLASAATAVAVDQANWIASVRTFGDKAQPVADWMQAHLAWLGPIHTAALLACLLALAVVVLRATRFLRPVLKGATLLQHDLDVRRRDLKGLLAHQTRRVDGLASDVAAAGRRASEADRRSGAPRTAGAGAPRTAGATSPAMPGAAFFVALAAAMTAGEGAPRRVLLAIDDLDLRSGEAAAAFLDTARRLAGPGVGCVVAASRSHLVDGFGESDAGQAFARFERCIQIGYRLDAAMDAEGVRSAYAGRLAGLRPGAKARDVAPAAGADWSALDRPWRPREAETLAALSVFAGETPRAVKRFVNLYRVARADPRLADAPAPAFTALALALALDNHGLVGDLDALAHAGAGAVPDESPVLRRALAVAREASGEGVDLGQNSRGIDVAGRYAMRG